MKSSLLILLGALLTAAPVFSQGPDPLIQKGELKWFSMNESFEQVAAALGPPTATAEFGNDYISWQYQIGDIDHHDFSHQLVFRRSSSTLTSITRNYEPERNVDHLFPPAETSVHEYKEGGKSVFSVRLRPLSNGRVLMALGVSPNQTTGQLVLIRRADLRYFYSWLDEQLTRNATPRAE